MLQFLDKNWKPPSQRPFYLCGGWYHNERPGITDNHDPKEWGTPGMPRSPPPDVLILLVLAFEPQSTTIFFACSFVPQATSPFPWASVILSLKKADVKCPSRLGWKCSKSNFQLPRSIFLRPLATTLMTLGSMCGVLLLRVWLNKSHLV